MTSAPGPRTAEIVNIRGLHARAARKFVLTAQDFDAVVYLAHGDLRVRADSIMEILMLAAPRGAEVVLDAEGPQATEALDALEALIARRFDEER